ncbi:uncharacterized protein HMPREF1541_06709 [Cyphellophora europaea CBS 101466]|uniref:Inner kinetochore subunit AME1 domain-containing protein n=1 Tax=Cyphellophora europaea (strain CBS 101466) TaxID=1220924 RepID=W2RQB7_CYPE1|nr:uncharacterized protein HMPREF1541_06709 [Cyphellophora europaea CBS 101466]ETN38672.1 hypothetical protein HMPREF1541_06709 [Cyphellophora europaea CBS 101466]
MASQSRHERQLMRQRGAGRNVGPTDFGLDFGFGAFQTPARSSRSKSKTPATQLSNGRRTSRTSVRRSREPSQPRSRRSASFGASASNAIASQAGETQRDIDNLHSAKRRRTAGYNPSLEAVEEPHEQDAILDGPEATSVARQSEDSIFNVAAHNKNDAQDTQVYEAQDDEKENYMPTDAKKSTHRRKRKSIGQQSMRKKKRPSSDAAKTIRQNSPVVSARTDGESSLVDEENAAEDADQEEVEEIDVHSEQEPVEQSLLTSENAMSTGPSKKRRKRKSIGQQKKRKNRKSSEHGASRETPHEDDDPLTDGLDDTTEPEAGSRENLVFADKKRSTSAASSSYSSPVASVEKDDLDADEDYEHGDSPEPPTPAPPRRPAKSSRAQNKAISRSTEPKRQSPRRSKTSFPIVTHRMTNLDMLPRIDELGESEQDWEERAQNTVQQTTNNRANPNGVDVLAQYCRETIQSTIDRLNAGTASSRMERKRKQTALEAVGQELNDRLTEMSAAVENRVELESRVRKTKRSKAELQARWIEVRRQREEIALKCDQIRQQNWEREKEREEKWAVSEAAHRLELEIERGELEEEESLQYLLRSVAADVSDQSGKWGLLDRIKRFNGRLERMAGVLEGRDV